MLILDLGTNDLCSRDGEPLDFFISLREFVDALPSWNIHPDKVVFLPILPKTGSMQKDQVSVEDKWYVWRQGFKTLQI